MTRTARQKPRAVRLLEPRHWQLLWLLGAANFFAGYDFNIVTVALPQLRASYHLSQSQASLWIAVIYLGAAPAVLLGRRADRHGRRRLLLFSISGYTLATLATAAAPTIGIFAGCQLAARFFLCAEGVLVWTMVAEELPAAVRGFGFGWLAMLSALGTGWSAILYGGILALACPGGCCTWRPCRCWWSWPFCAGGSRRARASWPRPARAAWPAAGRRSCARRTGGCWPWSA